MNPTTFDMPETIDDEAPVDELQELIDEENAEPGPHPTEPDCNKFGVFVRNVETIEVPMKKAWKTECLVELGRATDGRWYAGYHFKNGSAAPSLGEGRTPYRSKKAAVLDTLRWMLGSLGWKPNGESSTDQRIGAAIAKFMEDYEVNQVEVITAGHDQPTEASDDAQPKHDPEFQEAVEDAKAAGLTVGEPISTQAPVDQAVADFKRRMHEATESYAACSLRRNDLEVQFKEAKAEEKAALEVLKSLSSRGVERMPLFDKKAADASGATAAESRPAPPPRESDAWKAAPLAELGLPKGLTEKLEGDGITTIGRLEQRRADVANKQEKWPKGVGKAAIDKLEDAILKWLADNRDTWQPPAPAAAPPLDERLNNTTLPNGIAANDPDAIGDVVARANWLANQAGIRNNLSSAYESGQEAFDRGDQLADCPYVPTRDEQGLYVPGSDQDQWLYGWIDAEAERDDAADTADAADDEASE